MTDLEIELIVLQEALREADESFRKLLKDYQALREYADKLETLLSKNGISFPEFCGW